MKLVTAEINKIKQWIVDKHITTDCSACNDKNSMAIVNELFELKPFGSQDLKLVFALHCNNCHYYKFFDTLTILEQ